MNISPKLSTNQPLMKIKELQWPPETFLRPSLMPTTTPSQSPTRAPPTSCTARRTPPGCTTSQPTPRPPPTPGSMQLRPLPPPPTTGLSKILSTPQDLIPPIQPLVFNPSTASSSTTPVVSTLP